MEFLDNVLIGLFLSSLIGVLAYRRGSLSPSGGLGAVLVGTAIFSFGGWVWGLTLIVFFVSSSALSHYKESVKENLAEKFAKGHRRDLAQTLANGGAGALLAIGSTVGGSELFFAGFLGAMATVNADTWATELGVLNRTPPRLITNGQLVEVGSSGGVSRLGTLATAGGALAIGAAALIFELTYQIIKSGDDPWRYAWVLPVTLVSGMVGGFLDSLLGATVQAIYYCPHCGKETEKTVHGCGTATQRRRGWGWLDNDSVNFLSSVVGAGVAAGLYVLV